jgi:hypothetical protein
LLRKEEYYLPKGAGVFSLEAEMYQRKELMARVEDREFPCDAPWKPFEEGHCKMQRQDRILTYYINLVHIISS